MLRPMTGVYGPLRPASRHSISIHCVVRPAPDRWLHRCLVSAVTARCRWVWTGGEGGNGAGDWRRGIGKQ